MNAGSLEQIFRALAGVRYLVAGGLAVVAHGFVRFTNDVDLVLDLEEENCRRALEALGGLGYRPLVPVALEEFARAERRAAWAREKGAKVFQLLSDEHPRNRIDLFLEAPFDFDAAYAGATWQELGGIRIPFVGLDELLEMKRRAGRRQDLLDVEELERLRNG